MEETILKAVERTEKLNAVRKSGFTPGVLNGPGTSSTSVQFESLALNKIIAKHGANAKLWVVMGDEKKFGYIKEVQRHPVEKNVIHAAIQMVSVDQESKMQLPIVFRGHTELEHRMMMLQVHKSEIKVEGRAALMPDEVFVDVSKKEIGDSITAVEFNLPKGIKILDAENEVYAVVKPARREIVEEPAEETAAAASAATTETAKA